VLWWVTMSPANNSQELQRAAARVSLTAAPLDPHVGIIFLEGGQPLPSEFRIAISPIAVYVKGDPSD
jgi:hypothetical protein